MARGRGASLEEEWKQEYVPIAKVFCKLKRKKDVAALARRCTHSRGAVMPCAHCKRSYHLTCLTHDQLMIGTDGDCADAQTSKEAKASSGSSSWACPHCTPASVIPAAEEGKRQEQQQEQQQPPPNRYQFINSDQHGILMNAIARYVR